MHVVAKTVTHSIKEYDIVGINLEGESNVRIDDRIDILHALTTTSSLPPRTFGPIRLRPERGHLNSTEGHVLTESAIIVYTFTARADDIAEQAMVFLTTQPQSMRVIPC